MPRCCPSQQLIASPNAWRFDLFLGQTYCLPLNMLPESSAMKSMKKRRQALFLTINSAAALVFTLAAMGVLMKASNVLPPKVVQSIGPQMIRVVWPLLALELVACGIGVFLFCRNRKGA